MGHSVGSSLRLRAERLTCSNRRLQATNQTPSNALGRPSRDRSAPKLNWAIGVTLLCVYGAKGGLAADVAGLAFVLGSGIHNSPNFRLSNSPSREVTRIVRSFVHTNEGRPFQHHCIGYSQGLVTGRCGHSFFLDRSRRVTVTFMSERSPEEPMWSLDEDGTRKAGMGEDIAGATAGAGEKTHVQVKAPVPWQGQGRNASESVSGSPVDISVPTAVLPQDGPASTHQSRPVQPSWGSQVGQMKGGRGRGRGRGQVPKTGHKKKGDKFVDEGLKSLVEVLSSSIPQPAVSPAGGLKAGSVPTSGKGGAVGSKEEEPVKMGEGGGKSTGAGKAQQSVTSSSRKGKGQGKSKSNSNASKKSTPSKGNAAENNAKGQGGGGARVLGVVR
ncbi:unnamed protein product, partial [Choristocarpus tenellus]